MDPTTKIALDNLPLFEWGLDADERGISILEIALITTQNIPNTKPLYKMQYVVGVIGKDKEYVYATSVFRTTKKGTFVYDTSPLEKGGIDEIPIDKIESYRVLERISIKNIK